MKHRRLFVALTFASSPLAATANAGHLTRDNGAQVGDNQNSQTAGADGPVLLQGVHLIQKLQRFEDRRGNAALLGAIFKGEVGIARQLMAAACTTSATMPGRLRRCLPPCSSAPGYCRR